MSDVDDDEDMGGASGPDYPAAIQIFKLLHLLEQRASRAMPINELAEKLEVHRRTVIRYVDALSRTVDNGDGQPIVRRERRGAAAWAVLARREEPLPANVFQYAVLYAASRPLAMGGSILAETLEGVLERVEEGLGDRAEVLRQRVHTAFHYVPWGPKDYGDNGEILDALMRGVLCQHPVELCYRALGKAKAEARRLEPFTLVLYRDGLYAYGRVVRKGRTDLRLYAVDRIESAALDRSATFAVPEDFDPRKVFGQTLGLWQSDGPPELVDLAFVPEAAALAGERRWPGFQGWRTAEDGRQVLSLKVTHTPELVAWVATWGPLVEVLGPPSLREQVRSHLRSALTRYEGQASGE